MRCDLRRAPRNTHHNQSPSTQEGAPPVDPANASYGAGSHGRLLALRHAGLATTLIENHLLHCLEPRVPSP